MLLRYYLNEKSERVYTTDLKAPNGTPTFSAHPARFSPDDKFSAQRMATLKRFNLLKTQKTQEPF